MEIRDQRRRTRSTEGSTLNLVLRDGATEEGAFELIPSGGEGAGGSFQGGNTGVIVAVDSKLSVRSISQHRSKVRKSKGLSGLL